MGYNLVRHVEALGMAGRLDPLSHSARLVLVYMALNAHDHGTTDAPRATYFRGWEHLASAALGRSTYDEPTRRAVARAVSELIDAGLVKVKGRRNGERHGRAMYELTI